MTIATKRSWSKSPHGGHVAYGEHGSAQVREGTTGWHYEVFHRGKLVAKGFEETRATARFKAETALDRDLITSTEARNG
jgi:hypothetical protein